MHCALHIIGSMTDSWDMRRLYIEGAPPSFIFCSADHLPVSTRIFFCFHEFIAIRLLNRAPSPSVLLVARRSVPYSWLPRAYSRFR